MLETKCRATTVSYNISLLLCSSLSTCPFLPRSQRSRPCLPSTAAIGHQQRRVRKRPLRPMIPNPRPRSLNPQRALRVTGVVFDRLELAKALGVPQEHVERLTPKKMKSDPESSPPSPLPPVIQTLEAEPPSMPSSSVSIPDRADWRAKRMAELR